MILPSTAHAFEWRKAAGRNALVCRPLADVAVHLFTTRDWRLGSGAVDGEGGGWAEVADAIGLTAADVVRARQVHGTALVEGRQSPGVLREADILLARDPGLATAVQVADCVPILLADAATGAVAAVHAGWRGLAAQAPVAAVAALGDRFGTRPGDLIAALGPSIGPCCYQVGPDVRESFGAAGYGDATLDAWFLPLPAPLPGNPPMPGLNATPRSDRWYFDGWAAAVAQLVGAGVRRDRVFSARLCTASHPGAFCSYRRDGQSAGRLCAAIKVVAPRV